MQIDGAVVLYGAGREARSTRQFLSEVAPLTKVYVTVDSGDADVQDCTQISPAQLQTLIDKKEVGLLVRSAGVSIYKPELIAAKKAGVEITTNINLWAKYRRGDTKVVAVTGTKGKSTTVKLTETMLKCAGLDACLGGNFGVAPLDLDDHDIIVMELSSYQVADLQLQPDYVGFTNLFPEHVDWHGSLEQYYHDKMNLLRRDGRYGYALGSQAAVNQKVQANLPKYANELPGPSAEMVAALHGTMRQSKLKGPHNADNMMIAAKLALGLGASEEAILEGLKSFAPPAHRLEEHQIGGLTIVDDSISTTPEATKAALATYPDHPIGLIVGGFDREQDYHDLANHIRTSSVTTIACLPNTGHRLVEAIAELGIEVDIFEADNLTQAMNELAKKREQFELLILSPAAPSYNHFRDYVERGEKFVELAKELFIS
ncbi:UDP-N-acetylmuramoyl-L-alanine--D-glutamate ligase [Maritalea porphyrae]|uniref:UDP-N-acetylmuramoyl-L-alanine--D-glutamate ligase n=1 Tax=Maritalea porphyrae TaxID=880732 RepID=UPI0022B04092|nr:UDP-N-acetylmuramoyl-L-alanine--D-glutamate ligase [Maritalea porphyrae]MCZ4273576.1 UDP-N-acetylmuramoyl-L-alanine--D-glutamate ligase [Maritalea porphyrae]